ncbi:protein-L-isoaspartate(D-aspartate) O-methyltransferase isoform X1 [Lates japonicus]|uniref:Protein-L-isoaspartate(D-aspartate) O-methyltransferase isoform X1 n=1 Tax=Lates japonicus TaxID=270547 RepID=A0AAD3RI34_LATJO|nr:protein-L-isoaspartate(D-aspartate) O-methyltransferase isoform X1 [Lates japonicus]
MSGDVPAAPPSALEVVSFVGKTVGAGAALTAAVYLLRKVCLIMAWKSGGASHAELVNNLRSESACLFLAPRCIGRQLTRERFSLCGADGG